jgi:PAS domain S-box-containing protein
MVAVAIGVVALVGWSFDVAPLRSVLPGMAAIQANTAFGFVLSGSALLLLVRAPAQSRQQFFGRGLACLAIALAGISLVEALAPTGQNLDRLWLAALESETGSRWVGRMSVASAALFILLGSSLLLLEMRRYARAVEMLAAVPVFVCLMALAGGAFSFTPALERADPRPSPFPAVTAFLFLAIGILHARPNRGWMAIITSDRLGGVLARRLLPIAILLPFLLAMARLVSTELSNGGAVLGLMLYVLANMLALTVFVVWYASALNRVDFERTRAQRELEHDRTLLRTLIDTIPDAIWTKDRDGRFMVSNHAHVELVGAASEDAVAGKTGFDFHPPDLARAYDEDDRLVLQSGETVFNKEEIVRSPSGREQWYLVIKAPLRDRYGRVVGLVGISRNIQDRKEADRALRESEGRHQAFFEATTAGMVEVSPDARILRANHAFCQMLGYTAEEITRLTVADILFPEDRDTVLNQYSQAGEGRTNSYEADRRYRRKDGSPLWARVSVVAVHDTAGRPAFLSAVVIDLSARREAEESLRASEERFRLLVNSVRDYAVFMLDPAGRVLTWNSGAERITGHTAAEITGKHFSVFHPAQDVAATGHELEVAARDGRFETQGWRIRKDGSRFWAQIVTSAVRDSSGILHGFAKVTRDLTRQRILEEQFRQAQKMEAVGRLTSGVAHDFNNLLTIINGYGQIVLDQLGHDHPAREMIEAINSAGERAARLTSQLLAFSRKAIVEPRELDLNEVVDQSTKLIRRLIGEDIVVSTDLDPHLGGVRADPSQIEQVLLNLAVNAKDAMPYGGKLTVETRSIYIREADRVNFPDLPRGPYVQLAVSDTGVGMNEEIKSHLFEPFFTTKEPGKGTGLGLAVVHGAVKQNGGRVDVYSEIGHGTTFKILLPALNKPPPTSGDNPLAPRGTETVVLVEDEEHVRKFARLALEAQGYTVIEASTGAEGLERSAEYTGPIHLLITDVVMPGMGGREVAEKLRERLPRLKVLFVSGYTDDAVVRHGIVTADDAFLQKPYTPLSLARKVRAVLDVKS